MRKPRIIKISGLWRCRCYDTPFIRIGIGFTPLQAYEDWASRNEQFIWND